MFEMLCGTIGTALESAEPRDLQLATELIDLAALRVEEHLRLACELSRRMHGCGETIRGFMAEANGRRGGPVRSRAVVTTAEFEGWTRTLDAERTAKVAGAIERVAEGGATLGRPRVDVIYGSQVPKLKEARVDRGIRLLFAFDFPSERGHAARRR